MRLLFDPVIPLLRIRPAGVPAHISLCMNKILHWSIDSDIKRLDGGIYPIIHKIFTNIYKVKYYAVIKTGVFFMYNRKIPLGYIKNNTELLFFSV